MAAAPASSSARATSIDWLGVVPAGAHLHRDGDRHAALDRGDHRGGLRRLLEQRRPGAAIDDLAHGAAHVDVDDVGAAVDEPRSGLARGSRDRSPRSGRRPGAPPRRAWPTRACAGGRGRCPPPSPSRSRSSRSRAARAMRRNAMFVKPAIGARKSGGSTTIGPRRIGGSARNGEPVTFRSTAGRFGRGEGAGIEGAGGHRRA